MPLETSERRREFSINLKCNLHEKLSSEIKSKTNLTSSCIELFPKIISRQFDIANFFSNETLVPFYIIPFLSPNIRGFSPFLSFILTHVSNRLTLNFGHFLRHLLIPTDLFYVSYICKLNLSPLTVYNLAKFLFSFLYFVNFFLKCFFG